MSLFLANRIVDNVFVGSRYAAEDGDFLFTNQIRRVVNLCCQRIANRFQMMNVRYLSFNFDQNSTIFDPNDENISNLVRFVQEAIENDVQLLIHSENGDNRSVVFAAGYLVHRFHWPPERALDFIAIMRPDTRPQRNLVAQLVEFASRRRDKYGPFKDIFGPVPPPKMNDAELLHRNTFLNCRNEAPDQLYQITQRSPVTVLQEAGALPERKPLLRWRDGLTATQPPARFASFAANNQPVNPHLTSALFRGRTASYREPGPIKCIPLKVDSECPMTLGFDYTITGVNQVHPDGGMKGITGDLAGHPVWPKPISILHRFSDRTRRCYDPCSVFVTVDEFSAFVRNSALAIQEHLQSPLRTETSHIVESAKPGTASARVRPTGNAHQQNPMASQLLQPNTISYSTVDVREPPSQRLFQSQQKPRAQLAATVPTRQPVIPDLQYKKPTAGVFQKQRPPTPPKKTEEFRVQALPAVDRGEKLRPVSQQPGPQNRSGAQKAATVRKAFGM